MEQTGENYRKIDIFSSLISINCQTICQEICSYLDPQDLCRVASVCSEWRNIVKQDSQIGRRWREFLDERKRHFTRKGKENHGTPSKFRSAYPNDLIRFPLSSINLNQLHERREDTGNETALRSTEFQTINSLNSISREASDKLRSCPKCTSPSNFSKTAKDQCQCQKCGNMFCSVCLRETELHTSRDQCKGLVMTPPTRTDRHLKYKKTNRDVVGSKKSIERLRRLGLNFLVMNVVNTF